MVRRVFSRSFYWTCCLHIAATTRPCLSMSAGLDLIQVLQEFCAPLLLLVIKLLKNISLNTSFIAHVLSGSGHSLHPLHPLCLPSRSARPALHSLIVLTRTQTHQSRSLRPVQEIQCARVEVPPSQISSLCRFSRPRLHHRDQAGLFIVSSMNLFAFNTDSDLALCGVLIARAMSSGWSWQSKTKPRKSSWSISSLA